MSVILVTGATDGIGLETAKQLVQRGADVVVHGRTTAKAEAALAASGAKAALSADLADLAQVRALAQSSEAWRVDVLVNNAGTYSKRRTTTHDGRELTMAVNHDAPFLLTHLLLPLLKRVVNVSSIAHSRGRIDVDDIDMKRGWDGYGAYAASKLANVLFTVELAKRHPEVLVSACHPGVVTTKLLRAGFNMNGPDSLADGAATSVFLACDAVDVSGRYYVRCMQSRASYDPKQAAPFY